MKENSVLNARIHKYQLLHHVVVKRLFVNVPRTNGERRVGQLSDSIHLSVGVYESFTAECPMSALIRLFISSDKPVSKEVSSHAAQQ